MRFQKILGIISAVGVLAGGAGILGGCRNVKTAEAKTESTVSSEKTNVINKTTAVDSEEFKNTNAASKVVDLWASDVKNKDTRAQYALLSSRQQKVMSYEKYYENNHTWAEGTSSPYIAKYRIVLNGMKAAIEYDYETSEGFAGTYKQKLTLVDENGGIRVDEFSGIEK